MASVAVMSDTLGGDAVESENVLPRLSLDRVQKDSLCTEILAPLDKTTQTDVFTFYIKT